MARTSERMTRRDAVAALGALVATGATRPALLAGSSALRDVPGLSAATLVERPGLQLYTVRSEMQKGVEATLERVARIGYREVEFAGLFGRTSTQVASALKANGLTAPALHVDLALVRQAWDRTLDEAAMLGQPALVVAWVGEDERTADGYRRLAAEFNRAGQQARGRGMSFAYHNHDFEFRPLGTTNGHEILMKECDPGLVQFELDLFWVTKGGQDAAAYVARHPGRFPLVHVKDMSADGRMTEVGAGVIDFQRIFAAARGGIRHFFVEHDEPSDPFASITTSLTALRRYTA